MSKKPPKDTGKKVPFPGVAKGKGKPKRSRIDKMAKPPQADEDLFDRDATLEQIKAEHADRTAREEAETDEDERASRALNPKQRAFAEHYAKEGNATKAYRLAGYTCGTPESAQNAASRLLGHVGVRAYIGELLDELASPRIADARERQEFLTAVIRGQVKRKSKFYGETITVHADVADGIRAVELMAKMNGELTEKKQVEGDVTIRIVRGNAAPSAIGVKAGEDD